MKYFRSKKVLQNSNKFDNQQPSIKIHEDDVGWKKAYENWINNKPPTNHPEWERGVFMYFEPIIEKQKYVPPKPTELTGFAYIKQLFICSMIFFFIMILSILYRIFE